MRSILALSLLVTLYGSANAATMHHAHRRHAIVRSQPLISSDPASGFAYAPLGPPTRYQPGPCTKPYEERLGTGVGNTPKVTPDRFDPYRKSRRWTDGRAHVAKILAWAHKKWLP